MTITNRSVEFLNDPSVIDGTHSDLDPRTTQFNSQARSSQEIKLNNFVDVSDELALRGLVLSFCPANSGANSMINFKAFVTAYNETFSSDYVSEQVFGRIDPIHTFKQTTRNISLNFVIPCSTPSESFTMLNRVDRLRSFLYPTYTNLSNALTIDQSPLMRISIMNLLTNNRYNAQTYNQAFGTEMYAFYDDASDDGVLAAVSSMAVNFHLESDDGVFIAGGIESADGGISGSGVYPKLIEIAMDFSIIHERNLGDRSLVYGTPNERDGGTAFVEEYNQVIDNYAQTQADEERANEEENTTAAQAARDQRIAQYGQTTLSGGEQRRSLQQRYAGINAREARAIVQAGYYEMAMAEYYSFDRDVIDEINSALDVDIIN